MLGVALRRRTKKIRILRRRTDAPGPSATDNEGQYGAAPQTQSDMRYCLREIAKNPLRYHPSSIALYGMEPDGALLTRPVFTTDFAAGRHSNRNFTRGGMVPLPAP